MRTLPRIAVATLALLGMLTGLATPANTLGQGEATPAPRVWLAPDAFYDQPAEIPSNPGVLLGSEPLTDRVLPAGSRAWRIRYSTRLPDDTPVVAVATVLAPLDPPPGPRPVVSWAHGSVGILQRCLPSVVNAPFDGVPALQQVVDEGWVLVATDYAVPGPDRSLPYLIGTGEARSVLDATRAARQMPELILDARTVVWGHSQGGQAALWSGIAGPAYAPDAPILGVAALAPATDMIPIVSLLGGSAKGALISSYALEAYSEYYPDVQVDAVAGAEAASVVRRIAALCQLDPNDAPAVAALVGQLDGRPVVADPGAGPLGDRLRENVPNAPVTQPLLVAQGTADAVIDPMVNDAWVAVRCAEGQSLTYWRVAGGDHGGIVAPGSPVEEPLIAWTRDRFAGTPPPPGCTFQTIGANLR